MDFRVLGPLLVTANGRQAALGPRKQRLLLAVLLCRLGETVSTQQLVEALWVGEAPESAVSNVHLYVHRLRRALGAEQIVGHGRGGYSLAAVDAEVDANRFLDLGRSGQASLAAGNAAVAATQLREALALWRGDPFSGLDGEAALREETARLEEHYATFLEQRIDADLQLRLDPTLVPELSVLVRHYPYRERFTWQFMLALYRAGRQADALGAYRTLRKMLDDELGIEPGHELKQLEQAILRSDRSLDQPKDGRSIKTGQQHEDAARAEDRDVTPTKPGAALQRLHDQILTADSAVDVATAAGSHALVGRAVPAQLPAEVAGFVGRAPELTVMDRVLARDLDASTVPVLAVVGSAGVGKTALAVRWAHRVAGLFPGGQLYVDLRGYVSGPPVRVIDALGYFLRALGVAAEAVPVDVAEAAALFRSTLADRRVLVVLDNARSVEQVRPMLPGSAGCVVVVTSRDRMAGLVARDGAHRVTLDVLDPEESRGLLAGLLGEDRVRAEPDAVAELAWRCANLPLALRIAAAALVDHPHRLVAAQVAVLRRGNRLAALAVDGDQDAAVLAAFDASYRAMPTPARRLFRLLGLAPCASLTPPAAAALAGIGTGRAAQLLDRLCAVHLLQEVAQGRFGFHDLLHQYAKDRAVAEDSPAARQAALRRLFNWYLRLVDSAAAVLYPGGRRLHPSARVVQTRMSVGGPRHAVELLDTERANLVTLIRHASQHGPRPMAWLLADGLRTYLDRRRYFSDLFAVARASLAAARAEGDLRGQAVALRCLANAYHCLGRYRPAIRHLNKIITLSRESDWADAQAGALANLGVAFSQLGRPVQALQPLRQALVLDCRLNNMGGQASTGNNLAMACSEAGLLRDGLTYATEALAAFTELRSLTGQANVLDTLAGLELQLGMPDRALDHVTRALALSNDTGSMPGQVNALTTQARVHRDAGRHGQAQASAEAAVTLAQDIGEQRAEAYALNVLGSVHTLLGEPQQAIDLHQAALNIAATAPFRYPLGDALLGLARATSLLGEYHNAFSYATRAREIAHRNQLRILETHAIEVLAELSRAAGHPDATARRARQALGSHKEPHIASAQPCEPSRSVA